MNPRDRIVEIVVAELQGERPGAGRATFDPFDSDALREAVAALLARRPVGDRQGEQLSAFGALVESLAGWRPGVDISTVLGPCERIVRAFGAEPACGGVHEGDPEVKRYDDTSPLEIVTLDGGSYPDTVYAWCSACGAFWDTEKWQRPRASVSP